jgi:ABC-type multidrug transport system ATPase subunit
MTELQAALTVEDAVPPVAAPAAGSLLELADIHKSWGARTILAGVDLAAGRGTLIAVSGANGIGKTTLLRIAAGLIHPDSGEVAIDGLHPERDRRAYLARLGFLSAGDRGLYARLSARRHLDLSARLALLSARERSAAVERALELFELDGIADRRADRLSTGQRQRVRLAMTFVHNPDLVLLDEPANSLDSDGLDALVRYLDLVRGRGGAAIWCTPEASGVPADADTTLRLANGRLSRL